MNKTLISTAVAAVIGTASLSANAALTTSSVLVFDDGIGGCVAGGTYPDNCQYGLKTAIGGSWFSMDSDGSGSVEPVEKAPMINTGDGTITPKGTGIHIGSLQDGVATGSHSGLIDGTESPAFSIWEFFGNTGMDYLTSPITVVDDAYLGNPNVKVLDMTGWTITWNGITSIPMGGDSVNFGTSGVPGEINSGLGVLTCSTATCSDSSTFTLDYMAAVPKSNPTDGGVIYSLRLEGQVSAVPVPTAAWLFGSGLLGLVGVARRKKVQA